MTNRIWFGLCLIFAVCVHALALIYLPENKTEPTSGAINNGQVGMQIGLTGSAGNAKPISSTPATSKPLPILEQQVLTPAVEAPLPAQTEIAAVSDVIESNSSEPLLNKAAEPVPLVAEIPTVLLKPKKNRIKVQKTRQIKQPVKTIARKKIHQSVAKKTPPKIPKMVHKKILAKSKKKLPKAKAKPSQEPKTETRTSAEKVKISSRTSSDDGKSGLNKSNHSHDSESGEGIGSGNTNHNKQIAGTGNSAPGGGNQGHLQAYHSALLAWLEKHKRYPRMAKRRHQQGTAIIYFKIDRNGRVLQHNIRSSSGHNALDREVSAMLRRATPLPAVPTQLSGQTLEFTLPVAFNINSRR